MLICIIELMMLWIPLDAQAFQGSVVTIYLQLLAAEALRIVVKNLNHTIDTLAKSVVLGIFCVLFLLYLCLGDKLTDF